MTEEINIETRPVWDEYPGYSFPVQLYHSFDMHASDYKGLSKKELELVEMHIHFAHMLVLARMDEEEYQDLFRSMAGSSAEERMQLMADWDYVCSVFDNEFIDLVKEHQINKGN